MFKTALPGPKKNSVDRRRSKQTERLQVEQLEDRLVPAGTWTALAGAGPGGTALLMTDGTVLASDDGAGWSRLTPDASGSYVRGTWSPIASMNDSRLYMGSVVLPDGRLFVAGGEYGSGGGTAEIYDPQSNTWTRTAPPLGYIADSNADLLPDGRILIVGNYSAPQIYNPATNSWAYTSAALEGFIEQSLAQLPNGNVLTVDGDGTAQMYVPSEDRWVSAGNTPTNMVGPGSEFGAGLLLPDGRAFFLGGNGTTAYYTPGATVNDPGSWQAGPSLPNGLLADDAPAAVMPNGHVLLEGEVNQFSGPSTYFDFNPSTNTYTPLPAPYGGTNGGTTYVDRMLVLPTGQVLFDDSFVYTPDSGPNPAWQPTVSSVSLNGNGSYHLTGTLLNGVSFGAGYGDDATMATNYPLVQLTDGSGTVYYARTLNWAPGSVGSQGAMATDFTLPTGLPNGTYSLRVIADGIASDPFTITVGAGNNQPSDPGFETPAVGNNFFGAFQYDPTGSPWRFTGSAGVSGNNSGFTSRNAAAPQGTQVAFLQGAGSQASQSVNFAAGSYTLSFQAAQRGNYQASSQTLQVLIDSTVVGTFTPASTNYAGFTTNAFSVAAGAHTIAFVGLNPNGGDNTAFIDNVQVAAVVTNQPSDPGFETPVVGNNFFGAFQYDPTGSPWAFTGGAGVSGNNSGFTSGNPAAPQGSQVAFLQQTGQASQSVNFAAGSYTLSFQAAQRGNYQASSQTFQVLIDSTVVGTFTPASTNYASFTTNTFTLAAGAHTIAFAGLNPNGGDNTAFIDNVHVNTVTVTAPAVPNASFESPNIGTGSYGDFVYGPTGASWTFSGGAGIAGNGSGFTSGNPNAPEGTQVAFLQQTGSVSQSVAFGPGGTFTIGFQAAQRGNYQASSQTFQVLVDSTVVGTFTPGSTSYAGFTSNAFTVAGGAHTIRFVGLNPNGGDNTAFIDAVRINVG